MQVLKFSVDSALLSELGEKLVENVHYALVELIKNSYDADATKVQLTFEKTDNKGPIITVKDNGKGMSFAEVQKYWMRIATTNKAVNLFSEIYGRPRVGSKGIGRFSCRRLGDYLKLTTTGLNNEHKYETTEVEFHWKNFKPGKDVTSIECLGERIVKSEGETGTTLLIQNSIIDEWTQRGYAYLMRQLAVLVANRGKKRDGYIEDPGFSLKLKAPDYFSDDIIDLREKLINAGWGTLSAKVNANGFAVCKLEAEGIGKREIIGRNKFSKLEGVKLKLGIMVDSREQMRDTSIISKGTLIDILKDWGGVQIKYNGFRVYPYGDDDWLDIDKERGLRKGNIEENQLFTFATSLKEVDPKRAKLSMLSMHSYVGAVEINSNSKGFDMKANREGFVYSESVKQLKEFVRFAIDWSTIYRDFYLRTKLRSKAELAKNYLEIALGDDIKTNEVVVKSIDYLNSEIKNVIQYLPSDKKDEVKRNVKIAFDAISKHNSAFRTELDHLRLVSSSSVLLLIFSHEVKALISEIEISKSLLKNIERQLHGTNLKNVIEIRKNIDNSKKRLIELIDMTSLIGIESKNAVPSRMSLKDRIIDVLKCFKLIIKNYDINITIDNIANNLKVGPILEAELYSIFLNLISNSIKSVIAEGKEKRIDISATKENNKIVIFVCDTGIGIDKSYYDDVFIPFISDPQNKLYNRLGKLINPEDKYFVGSGSGLGLSIIKEIIQNRNGAIRFEDPDNNWKTKLKITLP